jgi:hypothetical protein
MCKRLICSVSLVLVLVFNGLSLGEMIGYWTFDDPANLGADSSGKGNNGTVEGDAQFSSDAMIGTGALMLDGTDDYIRVGLGSGNMLAGWTSDLTIAAWMKPDNTSRQYNCFFGHTTENNGVKFELVGGNFLFTTLGVQDYNLTVSPAFQSGEWAHVALTFSKQYLATFYANGKKVGEVSGSAPATTATGNYNIGYGGYWAAEQFQGLLDEVRIYNHTLSEAEIRQLAFRPKAYKPSPADGAEGVTAPLLGWTAGTTAAFHDVYFGTNPTPGPAEYKGRQGYLVYWFGVLTPGTTYYWRVDEIEADGTTIHTGNVWSFTAAPSTAWNPTPPHGARYVSTDADLSWSAGMNAVKHDVYFGTNQADVANGTGGTFKINQTTVTFDPGTLAEGTTYYWRIDGIEQGGAMHPGNVWSFTTMPIIPITDPNLVGWWKFDEGEGTTAIDWSGYGNHGTFAGNPQWVPGYDGGALKFDGTDDYVDLGTPSELYLPENYTYVAWFKVGKDINGDSGAQYILCIGSRSDLVFGVEDGVGTNGDLSLHYYDTAPGFHAVSVGQTVWSSDDWHMVAATKDSAVGHKIYLDGELKNSDTNTNNDNYATTRMISIGARAWTSPKVWFFNGTIDEVRIYGKALTQDQIKQVMRGDPLLAWDPSPVNRSTPDIDRAIPLSWKPGDRAAQHDVYLGTDETAVTDADASDTTGIYRGRQVAASYTPPDALQWGQTYYWRIGEYNTDGTISTGRVWSFTVADYLIVDDFESYTDDVGNRIFQTWRDGWGYNEPPPGYAGNGTGSAVGYSQPPFAEQSIVHGGGQSMPLGYDNSGTGGKARYSETQREWASPLDWTKYSLKVLTLYFYGAPANAPEQLYVALEDNAGHVKVVNHPDPEAVQGGAWQEWNIELTQFSGAGVNLQAIKKMYIGLGNRTSPTAGGTGTIYIDDIRAYPSRCVPSMGKPAADLSGNCIVDEADVEILANLWLDSGFQVTPVDPGTTGLVAQYPFNGNTNDAVGGHNGTITGLPVYTTGKVGQAIQLNGIDDMVTVGAVGISGAAVRTIAGWAKPNATTAIPGWTNIFGFVGPDVGTLTSMSFDMERRGGQDYLCIHVYGWERNIVPLELEWHHLAATYDGTTIRWYGDGRLVGSEARVLDTRDQVQMGKRADNQNYFPGRIDEVRIYSRALSDAQIAWLAGYTSPVSIAADLQQDNVIDFKDFAVLADSWLEEILWP